MTKVTISSCLIHDTLTDREYGMVNPSIFQSLDLFKDLPPDQINHLSQIIVTKSYAPGETIFAEGQPCEGFWILLEGAVKVVKTTGQGRQVVLATQTGISTVAEVPVFDGEAYPASLVTIQSVKALLILRKDFLDLCQNNPQLMLRCLRMFGRRLRHLIQLVEKITFGSIRQRLASELLNRSKLTGSSNFRLNETQEELAAHLGTVREVVSRNLSRFQSEGLIRIDRRSIEILNQTGLKTESLTEF